jgi:hypothetical protein
MVATHFTLKTNSLKREDLDDFTKCYNPKNHHDRIPTWSKESPDGRWRCYDYEELTARDKASLDIFWLKDESLEESEHLPEPGLTKTMSGFSSRPAVLPAMQRNWPAPRNGERSHFWTARNWWTCGLSTTTA